MSIAALIVAAGRGTRAGGDIPKQWQPLAGRRVIDWTLAAFQDHPDIDTLLLVINPADAAYVPAGIPWVAGGETRSASVKNGLRALVAGGHDYVLIHDAARASVSQQVIDAVITALCAENGAAPGLPVTDALWRAEERLVAGTVDRSDLYRAQTPQGFPLAAIYKAHETYARDAADDVEIARNSGLPVIIVPGSEENIKITRPEDFVRVQDILGKHSLDIRTGNGFDVHRFCDGSSVTLCGVDIPHTRALSGHSDADVGMHALTDAIYGALADGDIGQHFPPSDPQWKGAESAIFLRHAVARALERGFRITHLDCTLICETPKIGPYAPAMRQALAGITGLEIGRISVKATTSERLGFTGRGEGIAALATATLVAS